MRSRLPIHGAVGVVVAAIVATSCSGSGDRRSPSDATTATVDTTTTTAADPVPGATWPRGDAAAHGFDAAALDRIAADAEAAKSSCFTVVRHGTLVYDRYWNDRAVDQPTTVWSITKSVTALLVGIAQADGKLDLNDPVARFVPSWSGTPSDAVTIRNLLAMDSGRHYDVQSDYFELPVSAADKTGFAVALGQDAAPGATWVYNNAGVQVLDAVLKAATGVDVASYAEQRLFGPLGMSHTAMTTDDAGNTLTFMGLQTTCEDLARLGLMMLAHGAWGDRSVVPKDWVDEATRQPSQQLNAGYGLLWWLNRPGPGFDAGLTTIEHPFGAAYDGHLVEGAPEDMFWAIGLGHQVLQVDPGTGTVVVRLGGGCTSVDDVARGCATTTPVFDQRGTARVVIEAMPH